MNLFWALPNLSTLSLSLIAPPPSTIIYFFMFSFIFFFDCPTVCLLSLCLSVSWLSLFFHDFKLQHFQQINNNTSLLIRCDFLHTLNEVDCVWRVLGVLHSHLNHCTVGDKINIYSFITHPAAQEIQIPVLHTENNPK